MKNYYFYPNAYDYEYIICSPSADEALMTLKKFLLIQVDSDSCYKEIHQDDYDQWRFATIDKLPRKYTIKVYEVNEVIKSEIA